MEYLTGPLVIPFFVVKFAIGAVTPILLLSYMIWRGTTGKALIAEVTVSAALVLMSVMMRWNVVIGGQEISKTGQDLLNYYMPIFGGEGLLTAVSVALASLASLWATVRLLPPWGENSPLSHASAR